MGINLVVQVVAVRYLGQSDYGALAYALSITALATNVILLGQDQSLARMLPGYEERGDFASARGAIVIAFATVFVLGVALVSLVLGLHAFGVDFTSDEEAAAVLVILIAIAPLTGLDHVFQRLFAVIARPTAIFWRRHVVTPSLRLAAVLFVVATGGSVRELAFVYVIGGLIGVGVYVALLVKVLRTHQLRGSSRNYPVGAMMAFGLPVYGSTLLMASRATVVIVLLERFQTTAEIAVFRAVVPVAMLNMIGIQSFKLLYLPTASRLYAVGDLEGLRDLYWRSASWLAIGMLPIFIVTFSVAGPLTDLLFGSDYEDSASVLALLSIGYYFSSTLGLNDDTLRASGRARLLLGIAGAVSAVAFVSSVVLIERYGALGAAIATLTFILFENLLTHLGLKRALHGLTVPATHRRVYRSVVVVSAIAWVVQYVFELPLVAGLVLSLAIGLCAVWWNRAALQIADVIPEAARLPVIGRLIAEQPSQGSRQNRDIDT